MENEIKIGGSLLEVMGETRRSVSSGPCSVEVLGVGRPEARFSGALTEILSYTPFLSYAPVTIEVLGSASEIALPLFANSVVSNAVQSDPSWLTVENTISPEDVRALWSFSAVSMPIDPPISYSRVSASVSLAVLSCPITTISPETVSSFWSFVVQPAERGAYPLLDQVWSPVQTESVHLLVAQSMINAHIPVSGVFNEGVVSLVASALPLPMYHTPASVCVNGVLVAQKRPVERLPRSYTRAASLLSQAVTSRDDRLPASPTDVQSLLTQSVSFADFGDNPVGPVVAAEVTHSVVSAASMPTPFGAVEVSTFHPQAVMRDESLTAMHRSPASTGQAGMLVLQQETYPWDQSSDHVGGMVSLAAAETTYTSPDKMLAAATDAALACLAASGAEYPDPGIPVSPAGLVSVSRLSVSGADYATPKDIYSSSQREYVGSFRPLVAQTVVRSWPISDTPVPSFVELVAADLPMPRPETVAKSGIKTFAVSQSIAASVDYPSKDAPASALSASQITEVMAEVAEYPDPHAPTSTLEVNYISSTVGETAEFDPPENMHRPVYVSMVSETVSCAAEYPTWDSVHAPLSVYQLLEVAGSKATYPDKNAVQSKGLVNQLLETVGSRAVYPDKNRPQSKAIMTQLSEHIAIKDKSLYSLPEPPRKHRVQITIRYVY